MLCATYNEKTDTFETLCKLGTGLSDELLEELPTRLAKYKITHKAARLQVKTRELGTSILLTESTRRVLGAAEGIALRPRGTVALKGIAAPVEIYSVDV